MRIKLYTTRLLSNTVLYYERALNSKGTLQVGALPSDTSTKFAGLSKTVCDPHLPPHTHTHTQPHSVFPAAHLHSIMALDLLPTSALCPR